MSLAWMKWNNIEIEEEIIDEKGINGTVGDRSGGRGLWWWSRTRDKH